ncbi:FAD-dependent oxidoreductase [Parapedobacter deserti]|uniref:FAD-dependent oxidoreductase n=1 Tax=Parapedobacter deserti TaxID=1912957 RepID=A0ABV7JL78_9SPHI
MKLTIGAIIKQILMVITVFHWNGFASGQAKTADVLIVGGGASGTMAAIQAARMGAKVVVVEETPWLGGMLTAAGVSAIDGNHRLPAGLWGEFRQELYSYYGGPQAVETGWVSNTLFEPAVGNQILKRMVAKEQGIEVLYETTWEAVHKTTSGWEITVKDRKSRKKNISGKVLIDATELGDVMAYLQVPYYLGMDSRSLTNEPYALEEGNDIVQDLTYVITLKDFGEGADATIPRPENYRKDEFDGCCDVSDPATFNKDNNDCFKMLTYGRLPNNKYMINWPKKGNDIYLNVVEKTRAEREVLLEEAKQMTLRFVYYIQHELGFKNLGIAYDEYPTEDGFPMIPYHRESRRLKAKSLFALQHVMTPFDTPQAYYRTGIAVGDYTIDHHHYKYGNAPEIDFVKIRVPSYNVPMGSLIPESFEGLIVAEKSIGVSNIVNGATRLQPVVLGIGQAAGTIAALAVERGVHPSQVPIRDVQAALLESRAYIMPYIDVPTEDPHFKAMQRIGATGIIKGVGVPYKWANQTWFYPERAISEYELVDGLRPFYPALSHYWDASGEPLTIRYLMEVMALCGRSVTIDELEGVWSALELQDDPTAVSQLDRRQAAVLVDYFHDPFTIPVNFEGHPSIDK